MIYFSYPEKHCASSGTEKRDKCDNDGHNSVKVYSKRTKQEVRFSFHDVIISHEHFSLFIENGETSLYHPYYEALKI